MVEAAAELEVGVVVEESVAWGAVGLLVWQGQQNLEKADPAEGPPLLLSACWPYAVAASEPVATYAAVAVDGAFA